MLTFFRVFIFIVFYIYLCLVALWNVLCSSSAVPPLVDKMDRSTAEEDSRSKEEAVVLTAKEKEKKSESEKKGIAEVKQPVETCFEEEALTETESAAEGQGASFLFCF